MSTVHVVVTDCIDDPARPSGGNVYDRRICDELALIGWSVHEHAVPGDWPRPEAAAHTALTDTLTGLADGALVLIDGLIASAATDLPVHARRLRVVVLVHMPLAQGPLWQGAGDPAETRAVELAALSTAAAVVATSRWTKNWLLEQYAIAPDRIHVVEPGADAAEPASGTPGGGRLLCVAAVTPAKGLDVLVAALAQLAGLSWDCLCVGAVDRDPAFVDRLCLEAGRAGIADRIRFVGVRTGTDLEATYAAADVVVVTSHSETYGMVVTEALARGIPVIAAAVGGLPDALGYGTGKVRPGILVPPGDPRAVAAALGRWLGDPDLRLRLRRAARQRREGLSNWATSAQRFARVLDTVEL